jgi:COP9 signalosome complex subunit 5
MGSHSAKAAKLNFEIENDIEDLDAGKVDEIYHYDKPAQQRLLSERPWKQDARYFKKVRISSIALLRMAIHARSGGPIEVMGVMTGKILPNEFVVMDCYPLPVEGTETRVNALGEAYEYMVQYLSNLQSVGRQENIVGWYHSHPGYGCWLSGIDVGTQSQNQQYQDPYLALVIDPNRTISAGKVEIGAFRTYPPDYNVQDDDDDRSLTSTSNQSIALAKLEDFGAHANKYYKLDISYFKSSLDSKLLDLLWNKYWTTTLSQNSLMANQQYSTALMKDLLTKVSKVNEKMDHDDIFDIAKVGKEFADKSGSKKTNEVSDVANHSVRIGSEQIQGLISREINDQLFAPL